jgi:hypothetical protein
MLVLTIDDGICLICGLYDLYVDVYGFYGLYMMMFELKLVLHLLDLG